jgi:hypothetical protein
MRFFTFHNIIHITRNDHVLYLVLHLVLHLVLYLVLYLVLLRVHVHVLHLVHGLRHGHHLALRVFLLRSVFLDS